MKEQDVTRGRILIAGRDLDRLPERKVPALRREIGCVFQDFRLLPNKTVFQNVAYALQVLGSSRARIRQTVPETLELVGLAGMEKRLPHQLSGGEQQRVAIARAFVNRPPILLADEPTGNLDPDTSLGIVQLLDRINRTGTTVVMATHDTVHRQRHAQARHPARPRGARQRHGGGGLHDGLHPARPARRGDGGAATRRPARGVRRPRRRGPRGIRHGRRRRCRRPGRAAGHDAAHRAGRGRATRQGRDLPPAKAVQTSDR